MTLVPYTKQNRNSLTTLHNEMDDLFDSFFRGLDRPFAGYKAWPAIDVAEDENSIIVRAEVPGCSAEDIDISVYGNTLTISGEKKHKEEKKEKNYYHIESSYGTFRREITLPTDVDSEKVDAAYKDGVLSINMPKAAKAKAIKVKVKS
ncbi:MAG: Hsp20/alpha crystallin family protein [Sedimentisphaerales bacterium]|nr:Hsp20/alpha crystallin family protein [Sedimentisphaerales bacterium]